MDIKGLLLEHFLAWQSREREKKTLRQFAELLEISPQQLNHYWTGARTPPIEIIDKLYRLFGDERFYTISGYPVPDARLTYIQKHWDQFTEDQKQKAMEMLSRYDARQKSDTRPRPGNLGSGHAAG